MVRFVVEHENVLHTHQIGHHPLEHLAFGFQGIQLFASSLEQRASALGKLDPLTKLERVVVGDDDLRAVHVVQHVAWNEFTTGVVTVRVIRLEDTQTVFNRETRRDDEKPTSELLAVAVDARH